MNRTAGLKRTESPCILTGDRENFPTYGKSLGSGDKPDKVYDEQLLVVDGELLRYRKFIVIEAIPQNWECMFDSDAYFKEFESFTPKTDGGKILTMIFGSIIIPVVLYMELLLGLGETYGIRLRYKQ